MKRMISLVLLAALLLTGCASFQGGTVMWRQVTQEEAMKMMAEAGYESVVEFGGINTWPGEIEK